jgi:hypothetical protein
MKLARALVCARRVARSVPARTVGKVLRRGTRTVKHAFLFGVLPSLFTDAVVRHKQIDESYLLQQTTANIWDVVFGNLALFVYRYVSSI